MNRKNSPGKGILTLALIWTFLASGLPTLAQGDLVVSTDISGGSSAFVWRESRKARKSNYAARRKTKAKRTVSQRTTTRRNVISQSRTVAKRYRSRRDINAISPEEFKKADITLKRKSPEEASKIFAGAAEYFLEKESNLQKAAEYLEQAIELDPTNEDAKLGFSELSVTLGNEALDDLTLARDIRYRKAQSLFEQAIRNDAENSLAFVGLGQVFDEQDKPEEARANYEAALKLDSSLSEVKAALSYIYYSDGLIEEANKLIEEAMASGEDSAEIKYFLGLIRYKQGNDPAAEKALKESIALDAENSEAHYYLGTVLAREEKEAESIKSFEEAVRLDPKFVNAWFDLGVAYYNAERYTDAIRAFDVAVTENTNGNEELQRIYAESFVNWAETYRQTGQLDLAITKYRIAVSLNDDDADLFTAFGFVLGSKGLWKDAITTFEKAAEVRPEATEYSNLGWANLRSANDNNELRYFDREKVDLENARAALTKAVELDNKLLSAHLNLGSVLNDLDRSKEAIGYLKRATELRPDWFPAIFELGEAYFKAREFDNAASQFKKATDLEKKSAISYYLLGASEHMRGKSKDAKKAQDELRKLDARLSTQLENFMFQNRK